MVLFRYVQRSLLKMRYRGSMTFRSTLAKTPRRLNPRPQRSLGFEEAISELPESCGACGLTACLTRLAVARAQGASPNGPSWSVVGTPSVSPKGLLDIGRNGDAPPASSAWYQSVTPFRQDLQAMKDLIMDPKRDLLARSLTARQTSWRNVVSADHNAYHLDARRCPDCSGVARLGTAR